MLEIPIIVLSYSVDLVQGGGRIHREYYGYILYRQFDLCSPDSCEKSEWMLLVRSWVPYDWPCTSHEWATSSRRIRGLHNLPHEVDRWRNPSPRGSSEDLQYRHVEGRNHSRHWGANELPWHNQSRVAHLHLEFLEHMMYNSSSPVHRRVSLCEELSMWVG